MNDTRTSAGALRSGEAPDRPGVAQDDPRVVRALHEYLASREAGQRPGRQEFLARHADIAGVLAECLDGLEFVYSAASRLQQAAAASAEEAAGAAMHLAMATPVGDYCIRREVGRGGMGVVYEAEQISLGRRVAVKVLPFAAALDARQLQRFKNEAQAAACLHHQNIVPVYQVGHDRGVHYYAMQFIDGRTLADVIQELRKKARAAEPTRSLAGAASGSPDALAATPPVAAASTDPAARGPAFFRTAATLGLQAAEALEHAHQLGVVHRDVKPGNLLVDGRGNLWVTDFGLAHVQGDASLTMTGDLVGTLRYMSPEQALAQPVGVDHRTDIYSLGVTLYELLTLEPAFNGRNRQEVLRQIAFDEPRPPRQLDRTIPAELETIVLKAMAKSPGERYATAQEVADDLRHFLDDKPIRARRPTLLQRLARWGRRHRTAVLAATASAVAGLALTVVVLAISYSRIKDEQGKTGAALERERDAGRKLSETFEALQEQQQQTEQALRKELDASYVRRVQLADREWAANRVDRAEEVLDQCPADLRGWEWHFLKRRCHLELAVVPLRENWNHREWRFSPDGRRAASWNPIFAAVVIWDTRTGKILKVLTVTFMRLAAFSPDGELLATVNEVGQTKLWNLATGEEVMTLPPPARGPLPRGQAPPRPEDLVFSPDGSRLAVAFQDGLVQVLDTCGGEELLLLRAFRGTGNQRLAFGGQGQRLAAAYREFNGRVKGIVVWNALTGEERRTLPGPSGPAFRLAYNENGTCLALADSDRVVKIWRLTVNESQYQALPGHTEEIKGVTFGRNGTSLATASADRTVKIWDLLKGQESITLRGHHGAVNAVAFSPDRPEVISVGGDRTLRTWSLVASQTPITFQVSGLSGMAVSPDGNRLALLMGRDLLRVMDTSGTFPRQVWTKKVEAPAMAFSPDGGTLAVAQADGSVRLYGAAGGDERLPLPSGLRDRERLRLLAGLHGHDRLLVFSSDGKRLALSAMCQAGTNPLEGGLTVWDVATGDRLFHARDPRSGMSWPAFSPDGKRVTLVGVFPGQDRQPSPLELRSLDAATGQHLGTVTGPTGGVRDLAFSPDGGRRFTALWTDPRTMETCLYVCDVATGKELFRVQVPARTTTVAFGHDGKRLVTGHEDGIVIVRDAATGQELLALHGHTSMVQTVAFSRHAPRLFTADGEGNVKIWDGTPWEDKAGRDAKATAAEGVRPTNQSDP